MQSTLHTQAWHLGNGQYIMHIIVVTHLCGRNNITNSQVFLKLDTIYVQYPNFSKDLPHQCSGCFLLCICSAIIPPPTSTKSSFGKDFFQWDIFNGTVNWVPPQFLQPVTYRSQADTSLLESEFRAVNQTEKGWHSFIVTMAPK